MSKWSLRKHVYAGWHKDEETLEIIIGPQGKQIRIIGGFWWLAVVWRFGDKMGVWSTPLK
jgi:hypothetical protein